MAKSSLKIKVSVMLSLFFLIIFSALFIPAGTIHYNNGWMYFLIFCAGTSFLTFYFLRNDPGLIERRTQPETESAQIIIQSLNAIFFILLLVIPGLDFNYHWSKLPFWFDISGYAAILAGFYIVFLVFKQNSFLASNVTAYEGQVVISTGLYARVRHPMYSGAYLIILFTPFALGSYFGLIPALAICSLIFLRALHEERTLSRDLTGYTEYLKKVHYRFIPYLV